ncbi:hypothetical protein CRG98_040269 [Punica granatum]|uniref:Uncharacterized protein n=1 Tax=Punica granatum TaxID=22663 RepID=A0A2I0I5Q6_PUNGR|nr:hypothetical protein CRG98_040269 [Punica granatum]
MVDLRLFSQNDHHSNLWRSVRSREPLTLPQNSIGRHRGDVRPENCPVGSVFQTYFVFHDLCRAIWVNPIGLEPNDHHSYLRGSLRSRDPPTLRQNSIGSHRGDLRPENCPVRSRQLPAESVVAIRVCSSQNSPKPTHQRSNPNFYSPIPHPGTRYNHFRLRGNSGQDTEDLSRSLRVRLTVSSAFSGFLGNPGPFKELVDTGYRPR